MESNNLGKIRKTNRVQRKLTARARKSFFKEANLRGAYTWMNLAGMEKNKLYTISSMKKQETKYGDRVMVLLNDEYKLCLPERYNEVFTEIQIASTTFADGSLLLVNKGELGRSYKLEFIDKKSLDFKK